MYKIGIAKSALICKYMQNRDSQVSFYIQIYIKIETAKLAPAQIYTKT